MIPQRCNIESIILNLKYLIMLLSRDILKIRKLIGVFSKVTIEFEKGKLS